MAQQAGASESAINAALGCEGGGAPATALQSRLCTAAVHAATPAKRSAAWMAAAAWASACDTPHGEARQATVHALLVG